MTTQTTADLIVGEVYEGKENFLIQQLNNTYDLTAFTNEALRPFNKKKVRVHITITVEKI